MEQVEQKKINAGDNKKAKSTIPNKLTNIIILIWLVICLIVIPAIEYFTNANSYFIDRIFTKHKSISSETIGIIYIISFGVYIFLLACMFKIILIVLNKAKKKNMEHT